MKIPLIGDAGMHYVFNIGNGQPPKCVAAVVTDHSDASRGFITVREFHSMHTFQTRYSLDGEPGTWHWNHECKKGPHGE